LDTVSIARSGLYELTFADSTNNWGDAIAALFPIFLVLEDRIITWGDLTSQLKTYAVGVGDSNTPTDATSIDLVSLLSRNATDSLFNLADAIAQLQGQRDTLLLRSELVPYIRRYLNDIK